MNAPLRRNACPSLVVPMWTGDGLLARLNTVSGAISPTALSAIAAAAGRHGNGLLEVTRRGSLQIRGLTAESSIAVAADIESLGLDLRTGVPVETGPLAGLDPEERADPRPLAERLRAMIAETGLSARLGPKVSVVIDGGGQLSMREILADVRLTAAEDGGWQVVVGGMTRIAKVDSDIAVGLAFELLGSIAARGRIGRGRDLSEADFAKACRALQVAAAVDASTRDAPLSAGSPIGCFPLRRGRVALGVGLPFGQASADQLSLLAQSAEESGISEFRLALGRALLAICESHAPTDAFRRVAAGLGFVVDPADPRLRVIACAGAPACASAHLPARQIAADLAASSEFATRLSGIIHVSGCEKRCAEPESPQLTVIGMADGAHILKGRDGPEIACVAGEEAAVALRRVLAGSGMGGGASSRPGGPNGKS